MAKFHINDKGEAKECRAKEGNCPITKKNGEPHYSTLEEATAAYEKKQNTQIVSTVSKNNDSALQSSAPTKPARQNLLTEQERFKKMVNRFKQAQYERIDLFDTIEEITEKLVEVEESSGKWTNRKINDYANLLAQRTRVSLSILQATKKMRQVAQRIGENVDVELSDSILFLQKVREDEMSKLVKLREKSKKQQKSTMRKIFTSERSQRDRNASIVKLGFRIKESLRNKALWERYDQKQKDHIAFFKSVEPFLNDDEKELVKKLRGRKNIQKEAKEKREKELEELRAQPLYTSMDL